MSAFDEEGVTPEDFRADIIAQSNLTLFSADYAQNCAPTQKTRMRRWLCLTLGTSLIPLPCNLWHSNTEFQLMLPFFDVREKKENNKNRGKKRPADFSAHHTPASQAAKRSVSQHTL